MLARAIDISAATMKVGCVFAKKNRRKLVFGVVGILIAPAGVFASIANQDVFSTSRRRTSLGLRDFSSSGVMQKPPSIERISTSVK
jgi:hypothetical protein